MNNDKPAETEQDTPIDLGVIDVKFTLSDNTKQLISDGIQVVKDIFELIIVASVAYENIRKLTPKSRKKREK